MLDLSKQMEIVKLIFQNAQFDNSEKVINLKFDGLEIQEFEPNKFCVNRNWYDHDVGYVHDSDLFAGNLVDCLSYCHEIYNKYNAD